MSTAAKAIQQFLKALGHSPATSPELEGTPARAITAGAADVAFRQAFFLQTSGS